MKRSITGWLFTLVAVLSFGFMGCSEDGGGGGGSTGGISISVTGVTDAFCLGHTYAATFTDFNTRTGLTQTHLSESGTDENGNGNLSGTLPVDFDETDSLVFVYCDYSQQEGFYDDDATTQENLVGYTNQSHFNACGRSMKSISANYISFRPTPYWSVFYNNYAHPQYVARAYDLNWYLYDTRPSDPYTTYDIFHNQATAVVYNYYTSYYPYTRYAYYYYGIPTVHGVAGQEGDAFTSFTGNFGDVVTIAFTDLVFLGNEDHPTESGNIREWCNCLLGTKHRGQGMGTYLYARQYYSYYGPNYSPYRYNYPVYGYDNYYYFSTIGYYYYGDYFYYYPQYLYYGPYAGQQVTYWPFMHYFLGSMGNFTDTERDTNATWGQCILP